MNAIVFIPEDEGCTRWLTVNAEYCERRGYPVVAITSVWADVVQMTAIDGAAQVVVAARRDHLPPDRLPRVEIVAEWEPDPPPAAPPAPPQRTSRRMWADRRRPR